ncbi:hypothetical protein [Streptomyces sporangiiformans]|uniref:Integral membrane protein n=1 Tax=Streptomyces sporangiiformans TaxID=2315329 RepID=A0A505DJZ8_9ACTN|nr:hypothetical protein [Streptomyces sporangiiformans]TPQ18071.1 hypothetical protein FGD71_032875 [Streptomyces sporangiiformans]
MIDAGQVLLAEYDQVKQEQRARIGFRDNLLYATLGVMAAVIGSTLARGGHVEMLLLLPPLSVLLGWTYLVNDEKISAIGRYVRDELAPRLKELAPGNPEVFGWESAHRSDDRRHSRKRIQLAVDLLAFCVAPFAALVVYWLFGPLYWLLLLVSAAELAAVSALAHQVVRYADLGR